MKERLYLTLLGLASIALAAAGVAGWLFLDARWTGC